MHNNRLGYLTTDPANLGTALKISVRIRIPKLNKDGRLPALLKSLNLNHKYRIIKETDSKTDANEDKKSDILEISSLQTLGQSEVFSY